MRHHFSHGLAILTLTLAACGGSDDGSADGDGGVLPDISEEEGIRIEMGEHVVPPHREGDICIRIPLPEKFHGRPVYITGSDSHLTEGTHHFFMAYTDAPLSGTDPVPCEGDEALVLSENGDLEGMQAHNGMTGEQGIKMVFGAGVGTSSRQVMPGHGLYVKDGRGHFITNHHVLNLTDEEQMVGGSFNIYLAGADEIERGINLLNCLNRDVNVPAGSERAVTATCVTPVAMDLVILASHGHQYLKRFEARLYDGTKTLDPLIYESANWDSPEIVDLPEPLHLEPGQGITFTCHYNNTTDREVVYGIGDYGEMCATMNSYALPYGDERVMAPPTMGAMLFDSSRIGEFFDTTLAPLPF